MKKLWYHISSKIAMLSIAIFISTLFLVQTISYAACNPEYEKAKNDELARYDSIINLKSQTEVTGNNKSRLNQVKTKKDDRKIRDVLLQDIESKFKWSSLGESTLEYVVNFEDSTTMSGVANHNRIFLYDNNESGYAMTQYNFIYNKTTNKVTTVMVQDVSLPKAESVNTLSVDEQKNIENNKLKDSLIQTEPAKTIKNTQPKDIKSKFTQKKADLQKTKCNEINVSAATGGTYDRYAASNYAINYALNYNWTDYFNYNGSGWQQNGSDCANFSSQVLYAGGLTKDYGNNSTGDLDWYFNWNGNNLNRTPVQSNTWINVPAQMTHMYFRENTSIWFPFKYGDYNYLNNNLFLGDLLYVDWTNDGTYDHVLTISGWYFRSPTGNWEPKISAHSNNRQNIDWTDFIQLATQGGFSTNVMQFKGLSFKSPMR